MISRYIAKMRGGAVASRSLRKFSSAFPLVSKSLKKIFLFGRSRYCPVCESHVRVFYSVGLNPRPNALCPICGSRERHRLLWTFLQQKTHLFEPNKRKMLHVAPEDVLASRFRSITGLDYLSADLNPRRAMVEMDITDIRYEDNTFDVIVCNHVLEHIPDDLQAMSEFHRVLTSDGFAVFSVPIMAEETFEDLSVTSPEEREKVFGQHDHVRLYGPDFEDRLREAGFSVKTFRGIDLVRKEDIPKLGIHEEDSDTPLEERHGKIFFCEKRQRNL